MYIHIPQKYFGAIGNVKYVTADSQNKSASPPYESDLLAAKLCMQGMYMYVCNLHATQTVLL